MRHFSLAAPCGLTIVLSFVFVGASALGATSEWVARGATGRLVYTPDAQGDRVPDFSDVGYQGGGVPIPHVPGAVTVQPGAGDDTQAVQAAIDAVSALPIGPDGFRGAVELAAGEFQIGTQLRINTSGVVLRGAGRDAGGTLLRGTGTGQRDLIQLHGAGSQSTFGSTRNMIDKVVPVGARSFRVNTTSGFAVGDTVRITRPSTANWISDLGMDMLPPRSDGGTVNQWQAGSFDLRYDRVITRIEGDRLFVDAPLTNSFELQYGGGQIKKYDWPGRIENVGVENLRAESDFVSETDEDHAWNFVSIDAAQHAWVRDTASAHFGRSAVVANPGAKWVTVDNAINESPKSRITGGRRYTFDLSGQLELVTGSVANEGRHDFVNNSTRPNGPHVFHNSVANTALDESGPHQRWATGTLFDNITVDGDQINARNRGNFGTGHGWAGANMVIWNSTADSFIVQNPPTAQNWLIGSTGAVIDDQTFGPQPAGYIDSHGTRVEIDSLYEAQLADAADVAEFTWGGNAGSWTDREAWSENLSPGAYTVETRDYLVGDIDDFSDDGAGTIDDAPIDPAWEALIAGSSAAPITGFDDAAGNRNVAFTIQHTLDPGERVIHGSLALSLRQTGGVTATDFLRLFDSSPENRRTFTELGWDSRVNPGGAFVGVVDLGDETDHLQSGSVNVQVNDDTAVDWALYTVTVAEAAGDASQARATIAGGGSATIDTDVGVLAELTLGDTGEGGTLVFSDDGALRVAEAFNQHDGGRLAMTVGDGTTASLIVEGDASLDGEFELLADPAYQPTAGDMFTLVSIDGQLTGAFDTVVVPAIDPAHRWRVAVGDAAIVATVMLAGDHNVDGAVDLLDYTVWRDTLGTANTAADGNGDGVVNQQDYDIWAATFGMTVAGGGAPLVVPEPSALALLLLTAPLSATRSRTRSNAT